MSLEESLARIASALEKIAGGLENQTADKIDGGKTHEKLSEAKPAGDAKSEAKPVETKAEPEAKADKPKIDFNKDIRALFLSLLSTAKNDPNIGAKGATQLGVKLLMEYTTDPSSPLTAKTLPEEKYEAFIADVTERLQKLKEQQEG